MRKAIYSAVTVLLILSALAFGQGRLAPPQRSPKLAAQTLTVSNYLQPDGLPARDALTAISGVTFADSSAFEILRAPTALNGVSVWVDDIPQPIRSVTPDQVVFILNRVGPQSVVRVRTQSGQEFTAPLRGTGVWPGIQISGEASSELNQNFIPLAMYVHGQFVGPVGVDPIPIGQVEPTFIILNGSGWRNASQVRVRLNGVECRVAGFAAHPLWIGIDVVTFEIPAYLAGNGGMDLTVFVGNRESNFSRIYLGDAIQ